MSTAVPATSIRITPTHACDREISSLAADRGGRVGLSGVLDDLSRRTWPSPAPGLAVRHAFTWSTRDRQDRRWWPQGITSSADAAFVDDGHIRGETWEGRRLLMTSWYSRAGHGSRLSVIDRDRRRYQHILLGWAARDAGRPHLAPLRAHAGGICWLGPWVFIAATARGFHVAHLDDVIAMPRHGHSYVLPIRFTYRARVAAPEEPLRFSFFSLDRDTEGLLVGEYGRDGQSRRFVRFALDRDTGLPTLGADGTARPVFARSDGPLRAQGVVATGGRHYVTSSHGRYRPGSVSAGPPDALRRHRWATPMGPEDLTYWPSEDLLWSVTEHPRRRWIYAMRRSRFG